MGRRAGIKMKLVELKLKAKICRRCGKEIEIGEAWKVLSHGKVSYYCKECGDEIQL